MGLGCFISTGRSFEEAVERVRLAEELGYDSVYVTHLNGRESLTVLTAYAAATQRIRVGTGVVPIYTRTPATMAQTAATIADVSGGRLILGLGVSHRAIVEGWHGQSIDRPVAEMREYVAILRAILRGEDAPAGERWSTGFRLAPTLVQPEQPIYVAALSPAMLRLAGEVADGVLLWLCNPNYIRDVVVPEVTAGRERAGKPLDGFDIVPAVPCAVVDDGAGKDAAYSAMRKDLIPYFGLPFYRAMLERSGFAADIDAFDAAAPSGDAQPMGSAISDAFLDVLTAVGDPDGVRVGLRRYADSGATSPCVGPMPRTDFGLRCAPAPHAEGAAVAAAIPPRVGSRTWDPKRRQARQRTRRGCPGCRRTSATAC